MLGVLQCFTTVRQCSMQMQMLPQGLHLYLELCCGGKLSNSCLAENGSDTSSLNCRLHVPWIFVHQAKR